MKLSHNKVPFKCAAKLSTFRIFNGDTKEVIGYAVGWRNHILSVRK